MKASRLRRMTRRAGATIVAVLISLMTLAPAALADGPEGNSLGGNSLGGNSLGGNSLGGNSLGDLTGP